jgi:hypothetical protein
MLNKLKNLYRSKSYNNDYEGNLYFVNGGKYKGDYYVIVSENQGNYTMFNLTPDSDGIKVFEVPREKLLSGVSEKIVDFVERLPYNIYIDCKNVYLKNENSNSRLQQSTVPDVLAVEEQDPDE